MAPETKNTKMKTQDDMELPKKTQDDTKLKAVSNLFKKPAPPAGRATKAKKQDTKNKPNLPQVLGSQMKDSWKKKSSESSQAAKPRISKEKKSGEASQATKPRISKEKKSGEASQATKPRISKMKKSGKASQTAKPRVPKLIITTKQIQHFFGLKDFPVIINQRNQKIWEDKEKFREFYLPLVYIFNPGVHLLLIETYMEAKWREVMAWNQQESEEPTNRTLGSKTGDCQKNKTEAECSDLQTDSPSDEMRKRSLRSSSESEQELSSDVDKEEEETSRPEERSDQKDDIGGEKKRKASEEPENERPAKRLLIVDETLPTSEDASENNNSKPSGKVKMLGPKSKRNTEGPVEKPKKKLLGPKSKRKSYVDSDEEDNLSEEHLKKEEMMDQKVQQLATVFFRKKKPPKCNINLTSLFQSPLCRAGCGHCDEVGQYQIDLVDFDLTSQVVSMECTACKWTTVRQMTLTTKVVD